MFWPQLFLTSKMKLVMVLAIYKGENIMKVRKQFNMIDGLKEKVINELKDLIVGREKEHDENQESDLYKYQVDELTRSREDEWEDFLKFHKWPFLIAIYYILLGICMAFGLIQYIRVIITIHNRGIPRNIIYAVICMTLPMIIWVWSTAYDYWNYWKRKMMSLSIIIINLLIVIAQQVLRLIFMPVMVLTMKIPINQYVTQNMVLNLSRFILLFFSMGSAIGIGYYIFKVVYDKYVKENILHFKILRGLDLRKDKKFKYDFKVIKDMETGKEYVVKEKDRTLHTSADGTTGTAKTSSVLTPSVADDMDQKVFNEDYQKVNCLKEIEEGNFRIIKPFNDQEFSINYIEPVLLEGIKNKAVNRERQKRYNYLKYVSASAGITVVAPNAAFADEVYELAHNRKFKVNRVDPILTEDGNQKPDFIGINPLYVSPLLKGVDRDVAITNNANIFSDILQALYEMSGSGDAYFISLNNSVTIAICKLLMLTYPIMHNGEQPNAGDLQVCINDFELTKPYLDILVNTYGNKGKAFVNNQDRVAGDVAAGNINCGIWQDVYSLINGDLLGSRKEAMADRANGLRLQVNNFINHPLIRRVLCAEKTLDLDKALANGEIIVVNYALELGKSVSMGFGLFFLLSFSKACLRRPGTESTRILNLNYIDELPVLMHPELEQFFSIFRQYKVANIVALQTLDQMEKNPMTKYLKGVLLGNCAHQIVFGRVSPTEMDIYEKMAGKTMDTTIQKSATETSITHDKPSYSYSSRESMQLVNKMEGSDIRYRDFQEVTFFTVDNGSPVPPFIGKVNFLPAARRKGVARVSARWEDFFTADLLQEFVVKEQRITNRAMFNTTSTVSTSIPYANKCYRFTAREVIIEERRTTLENEMIKPSGSSNNTITESNDFIDTTGIVTTVNEDVLLQDTGHEENTEETFTLNDLFKRSEPEVEVIHENKERF